MSLPKTLLTLSFKNRYFTLEIKENQTIYNIQIDLHWRLPPKSVQFESYRTQVCILTQRETLKKHCIHDPGIHAKYLGLSTLGNGPYF